MRARVRPRYARASTPPFVSVPGRLLLRSYRVASLRYQQDFNLVRESERNGRRVSHALLIVLTRGAGNHRVFLDFQKFPRPCHDSAEVSFLADVIFEVMLESVSSTSSVACFIFEISTVENGVFLHVGRTERVFRQLWRSPSCVISFRELFNVDEAIIKVLDNEWLDWWLGKTSTLRDTGRQSEGLCAARGARGVFSRLWKIPPSRRSVG